MAANQLVVILNSLVRTLVSTDLLFAPERNKKVYISIAIPGGTPCKLISESRNIAANMYKRQNYYG